MRSVTSPVALYFGGCIAIHFSSMVGSNYIHSVPGLMASKQSLNFDSRYDDDNEIQVFDVTSPDALYLRSGETFNPAINHYSCCTLQHCQGRIDSTLFEP